MRCWNEVEMHAAADFCLVWWHPSLEKLVYSKVLSNVLACLHYANTISNLTNFFCQILRYWRGENFDYSSGTNLYYRTTDKPAYKNVFHTSSSTQLTYMPSTKWATSHTKIRCVLDTFLRTLVVYQNELFAGCSIRYIFADLTGWLDVR